jgi:hypothetical protein
LTNKDRYEVLLFTLLLLRASESVTEEDETMIAGELDDLWYEMSEEDQKLISEKIQIVLSDSRISDIV